MGGVRVRGRLWGHGVVMALVVTSAAIWGGVSDPTPVAGASLPNGFAEEVVFSGLTQPTAVRFASDGRVFVAEKSGIVKVFSSLTDQTPTVFADLRTQVHNYWDRGLLGLALDPAFPQEPWVYVLYTRDAPVGGTAPRWGTVGGTSDDCPTPPGPTADGCVVSGRLSRLQAAGDVMVGGEQVLIDGWCQQYPSHSTGSIAFGPDGALFVSAGDGASFNFTDYGQDGAPVNPCGDPPGGVGVAPTPPTAEGGALRSQDVRTTADPTGLSGAILRVDRATGLGLPGNPMASSSDVNARRIVAYGLRNPFRIAVRPGTEEVWAGDVGWNDWEEIDRVVDPTDATPDNFGWPCYEGDGRQAGYDAANLDLCESLYTQGAGAVVAPYFRYHHNELVLPTDVCPKGGSSIAGTSFAFATGGSYPAEYRGALFFADYSRRCIWAVPTGADGLPDVAKRRTFVAGAAEPVDIQIGPGGDLFYVDLGGTIRRIRYFGGQQPPVAAVTASPTSGAAPLTVAFDATASSDPNGDPLTFAWDLDGDGAFDDATGATSSFTYVAPGTYIPAVQVADGSATSTARVTISAGNTPPRPTITGPPTTTRWSVGDTLTFAGYADDDQDGRLAATQLRWELVLQHCPSTCHEHPVQALTGSEGSFVAPDHEHPAFLELRLTATDAAGLSATTSLRLDPATVDVQFATSPPGLSLTAGSSTATAPFTRTAINRSTLSVSAPSPQTSGGETYRFASWSDGGAASHNVVADGPLTLTATYVPDTTGPAISGLGAKTTPDRATITWTTSRPALSSVSYGTSPATMTTASTPRTLLTQHSVMLTGLVRRTTYTYAITVTDAAGRTSTATGTFQTK